MLLLSGTCRFTNRPLAADMRIFIWGGDSWANKGDDAVLAGTLSALRQTLPDANLVVASGDHARTAARHHVTAVPRFSLSLLVALARCNLVLWGGGQMVQNASSKSFLLVQVLFLSLALIMRKPVVCYAQGVGPVHGRLSRRLIGAVLARLTAVVVRDRASALGMEALGLPRSRVQVAADPSFCLLPAATERATAAMERLSLQRPFVVFALRRWGHYRSGWLPVRFMRATPATSDDGRYAGFCAASAQAADKLAMLGVAVLFLPMCPGGDQHDDIVAEDVIARMRRADRATVLRDDFDPALLKALLGRAELVVAMRTHAGILAADTGAPVVSLSYQGKGAALMEELGLPGYALDVDRLNAAGLPELVGRGWRDRAALRRAISGRIPELRQRSHVALPLALAAAGLAVAEAPTEQAYPSR